MLNLKHGPRHVTIERAGQILKSVRRMPGLGKITVVGSRGPHSDPSHKRRRQHQDQSPRHAMKRASASTATRPKVSRPVIP
jgi:hypothetical protein